MAKTPDNDTAKRQGARARKPVAKAVPERPRGGAARAIADLVPGVGSAAFRKFGFIQSSVVTRWPEIVGERYAAVTQPDMIRFPAGEKAGGTLHLTIVGAHAPMLQHVVPDIIARVNRFFGYAAVARVRMTQGVVAPRDRPQPVQPAASLKPIPADMNDSLRNIHDPELRTVLEKMASGLANPPRLPRIS